MAKFQLSASPTFQAKVDIHIPGGKPTPVVFTFKGRTRSEMLAFLEQIPKMKDDVEFIMSMTSGWDLEESFTAENVKQLAEVFINSPTAIFDVYREEITGQRLKN